MVVVPDLDLGASAEVDSAVAFVFDAPVDGELDVFVVFGGAEVSALAVEDEDAVFDAPVFSHALIGGFAGGGVLLVGQCGALVRVGDPALPAGEVAAVEDAFPVICFPFVAGNGAGGEVAEGELDACEVVLEDLGLGEDVWAVAERAVEDSAAAVAVDPADGEVVIGAFDVFLGEVGASGIEAEQDAELIARVWSFELVDFVDDLERGFSEGGGEGV